MSTPACSTRMLWSQRIFTSCCRSENPEEKTHFIQRTERQNVSDPSARLDSKKGHDA